MSSPQPLSYIANSTYCPPKGPVRFAVDGEEIVISSKWGEYKFIVKNSSDIRDDSIVIKANAIGVNYLTPPIISEEGENACYQEVKVNIV